MTTFEGQHPDEKIIFTLRQHPAVLIKPVAWLGGFTFFVILVFAHYKFSWVSSYLAMAWIICLLLYGGKKLLCYLNTKYILTNQRLIVLSQKGFFHKSASEADLSKIQNVSFEISGFWPSMWDFGTVMVDIYPPSGSKILLEKIEEPQIVQKQILSQIAQKK